MGKYDLFVVSTIEEKPSKRATGRGDHSMRQYVGITCPYCKRRFSEVVLERLGAKKSSLCKAHVQECPTYKTLVHMSDEGRTLHEQVPSHVWSLFYTFLPYFTPIYPYLPLFYPYLPLFYPYLPLFYPYLPLFYPYLPLFYPYLPLFYPYLPLFYPYLPLFYPYLPLFYPYFTPIFYPYLPLFYPYLPLFYPLFLPLFTPILLPLYSSKTERRLEETDRRLFEAERQLQEKKEAEARNDARHNEVMAQLTFVREQLSDVETQLSDKRQCLTDVREWGRLKEPDNTLVPQLTCREAALKASHDTESARLRAENEVLRASLKDKAPLALITRTVEAEEKCSRLKREWDLFKIEKQREVDDAVRDNEHERAQHGAAKLAYSERTRSIRRRLQAAIHPDKAPPEARLWATNIFQTIFEQV